MAYHHNDNTAEESRSKRQLILDAAYVIFSRKGYTRATVDEIINMADTGKGTVYNYFTNKEQLFYTLIQERNRPFEAELEQVIQSDRLPQEKIETMIKLFLQFYMNNSDLWRVLMHEIRGVEMGCSAMSPATLEKLRDVYKRVLGKLEVVITQGVSQGLLRDFEASKSAYSLFGVILTMVYQNFVEDVDEAAHALTDIYLNGMARKQ